MPMNNRGLVARGHTHCFQSNFIDEMTLDNVREIQIETVQKVNRPAHNERVLVEPCSTCVCVYAG